MFSSQPNSSSNVNIRHFLSSDASCFPASAAFVSRFINPAFHDALVHCHWLCHWLCHCHRQLCHWALKCHRALAYRGRHHLSLHPRPQLPPRLSTQITVVVISIYFHVDLHRVRIVPLCVLRCLFLFIPYMIVIGSKKGDT